MVRKPSCKLNISVLQQQQNLGRRFGTSTVNCIKAPPPPPPVANAAVRFKAVVLLLWIRC